MFIIGLLLTSFSMPMAIVLISNFCLIAKHPGRYRLMNGLSEEALAVMAIVFAVLALVGIILMVFGWMKRRNKAKLDSIMNFEEMNYCKSCKVNVAAGNEKCPICGRGLKE